MDHQATGRANTFQQWIAHPFLLPLLCASSWLAYVLFFPPDFSLGLGAEAVVGEATAEGIEVAKRVGLFYKCFFTVFLLMGGGLYGLRAWAGKRTRDIAGLDAWQVMAGIGIGLLWLQLMGSRQAEMESFAVALGLGLLVYQGVHRWRKLKIDNYDFVFLSSLSIGLAFLLKSIIADGFDWNWIKSFSILWSISFLIIFGIRNVLHRGGKALIPFYNRLLSPLAAVPLILVLSREFYFLCNHYGLYFLRPGLAFSLLLLFWVGAWLFYYARQSKNFQPTQTQFLGKTIFPILLTGLVAFALQQLYINYPSESFELANGANGIMRWFKFGEWPIFEWLSSHLLSDIDVRSAYCLLYGYEGNLDFLAFDYIPKVLFSLVGYYFLKNTFESPLMAFGLAMLFPFILVLIPGTHALALVTFFLLHRLLNDFSKKKLIQIGLWVTFLLLWKLEIGLSSFVGSSLVLFWYFLHQYDRKKLWTAIQIGIAFVLAGAVVFLIILGISDIDLLSNFRQALDYFGAGQAHGYAEISRDVGLHFQYHYFIFPFLIGCAGLFFIFQKPEIFVRSKQAILPLAIMFLIGYYLFNAQRGLVRHGLIEGTDSFISSFAYLIFGLFVFYLIGKKRIAIFWTCCVLLFLVQNYRHKNAVGFKSYLEKASARFQNWEKIKPQNYKVHRVLNEEKFAKENFQTFKTFMDDNFDQEATFIDFSTNPMLYFYTQRKVPSYFNQYLQNTVTEDLQQTNIKALENYDIPVVVFSSGKGVGWRDNHDGVPNTVRFAALSNYIYDNYKPYAEINEYNIWVRNDLKIKVPPVVKKEVTTMPKEIDLGKYPYYLANDKNEVAERPEITWTGPSVEITEKPNGRILLDMNIQNKFDEARVKVIYYSNDKRLGVINFITAKGKEVENYLIPLSSQYNWHQFDIDSIELTSRSYRKIKGAQGEACIFLDSSLIKMSE